MTRALIVVAAVLGGVVVFGWLGWALYASRQFSPLTGASWGLAAIVVGGVVVTGLLAAGLIVLAFYSSRRGYDDRAHDEFEPDG